MLELLYRLSGVSSSCTLYLYAATYYLVNLVNPV
jgi:hypothetical protein